MYLVDIFNLLAVTPLGTEVIAITDHTANHVSQSTARRPQVTLILYTMQIAT